MANEARTMLLRSMIMQTMQKTSQRLHNDNLANNDIPEIVDNVDIKYD